MRSSIQILKGRKSIQKQMEELVENNALAYIIHYSCESFEDKNDGSSSRITSIAIRNLKSGQTLSFSIHLIAEELKIPFAEIAGHFDELENQMLEQFYAHVNNPTLYYWIHWNMRDVNYGFAAIEHRLRSLGGTPIIIAEERKFDLARALVGLYGLRYIGHPRLESIIDKNNITRRNFLTGQDEAKAFVNKEFVKLHQSTLRKADSLANIFERTHQRSLKTNATWKEIYGLTWPAIIGNIRNHPAISVLAILGIILTFSLRSCEFYDKLCLSTNQTNSNELQQP